MDQDDVQGTVRALHHPHDDPAFSSHFQATEEGLPSVEGIVIDPDEELGSVIFALLMSRLAMFLPFHGYGWQY